VVLVVVEKLSKYGLFILIKNPCFAGMIVDDFVRDRKTTWVAISIVNDWDHTFMSNFGKDYIGY